MFIITGVHKKCIDLKDSSVPNTKKSLVFSTRRGALHREHTADVEWGSNRSGLLQRDHGPLTRDVKLRVAHAPRMLAILTCSTARASR